MVDGAEMTFPLVRSGHGEVQSRCVTGRDATLELVKRIAPDALASGYQRPDFLRAWLLETPHEPIFIELSAEGFGPVMLPLERSGAGELHYLGERHANGNFPVGRREDIAALAATGRPAIARALRSLPLRANAIVLERQLDTFDGVANPFVFANATPSPNVALSLSLQGSFEDVLSRHSAKRRRKRFRNQERQLADTSYRYISAASREDIAGTLSAFFRMKTAFFRAAGIADVFADNHVKRFFGRLFEDGHDSGERVLKVLEVGGDTIAIIGCTVVDGRLTVEFGSYDHAWADLGPGDMLFFLSIREATENGLDFYDFGIGDEPYKRGWCEIETVHHDTVIPLSPAGHVIGGLKTARSRAVRALKSNAALWRTAKRVRKYLR